MKKTRIMKLEENLIGQWPVISKFSFRKLLTMQQKIVWDNIDYLKSTLGITDEQFFLIRSFKEDFNLSEKIDMASDMMLDGLSYLAALNLEFNGSSVFGTDDIERVLQGIEA